MLYQADALLLLPQTAPGSAGLVLTDPPYNTTNASWDGDCPPVLWWPMVERMAANPVIVFSAQPFTSELVNLRRRHFRHEIIWHKTRAVGHLDAKKRPLRAHENVLVFGRRVVEYHPQKSPATGPARPRARFVGRRSTLYHGDSRATSYVDDGSRYPTDVFLAAKDADGAGHPCSKPVALLEWLILSYSDPGDLVVDPFMGSGSTGVACVRTGRRFMGIEREPEFFRLARERIARATEAGPLTRRLQEPRIFSENRRSKALRQGQGKA